MENQPNQNQVVLTVTEQQQNPKPKYQEKLPYKNKKEKNQKPQKEKRKSEYQYNSELITEQTVIPPLPKKNQLLTKPEINHYQQKQAKIREKISKLNQKKKQIRSTKFQQKRKVVKGQQTSYDLFKMETDQIKQDIQRMLEVKKKRNQLRERLNAKIEEAKQNNLLLKELNASFKGTRQSMNEKLRDLQRKLTTAQLNKQEQKQLNNQIMITKRAIAQAQSSANIEIKIEKAESRKQDLDDQIDRLKQQKQPFQEQYKQLKKLVDQKNDKIKDLKGNMQVQNSEKTKAKQQHDKQYQQWKQQKKKNMNDIEDKIKNLQQQSDQLWGQFTKKKELYWKQKNYIDFIEWQTRIKNKKVQDRLRDEKRKQYQVKEKQREKQEQKQKYIKQIQLCNFLINYCKNIADENKEKEDEDTKPQQINIQAHITEDAQWKKQKGIQIIQSKKSKIDEQPTKKKIKKSKKKVQEKKQQKFEIPYNVQFMFDSVKVLSPTSRQQIERAIKELKERQQLFTRACSQEVNEKDHQAIQQIKGKSKKTAKQTVKNVEDQFPQL